ncbi:MAG TPA: DEAD/DEAH box helicase [Syntrophomonadaceae bacterium]|nr:DEAD/DEAH box helicase [Syntrophomonadaceae bacterium]
MNFDELRIITPILKALKAEGYTIPTPIQEKAIPVILEGKDLVGCAQTGTGKTAAFAVPILQNLYKDKSSIRGLRTIKALILTPTRELAVQIGESLAAYGKYTGLKHTVVFGGVSQYPQTNALRAGVDILVATPGRLLDLMNQKYIRLDNVKMFVLDEADRMLDMGFSHDMKKIIARLPLKRQTLLFSATMPAEITDLVDVILTKPVKVEVTPASSTVDSIEQAVYFVDQKDKTSLLIQLLNNRSIDSALVFTRTKHGADKVVKALAKASITAQAIHGNKSQGARQLALNNFKLKRTRVLIATDIASRGIDVQELSHVINFDLPNVPETYVHRIGRTGRAGLGGTAVSFCDREEKEYLRDIQKLISKKIPIIRDQAYAMSVTGK